jgi:hypothetical protein
MTPFGAGWHKKVSNNPFLFSAGSAFDVARLDRPLQEAHLDRIRSMQLPIQCLPSFSGFPKSSPSNPREICEGEAVTNTQFLTSRGRFQNPAP